MAAPNYPRNGNKRSRPNHRKQTNGGDDLRFRPATIRQIVFTKIGKMDSRIGFEISLIVVEAIRGRCVSFAILTTTVSEIFGGQTNSSILVDQKMYNLAISWNYGPYTNMGSPIMYIHLCLNTRRLIILTFEYKMYNAFAKE